jgi:threonine/homoserine/homoserine lactone efflux protein
MAAIFLQSLVIGYSGAVMPGSLLTYALDKTIRTGAKAGFLISIGHSLLELLLVLLMLAGVGAYLGTETAKTVIGIVGGGVLLFFGITMLRDAVQDKVSIDVKGHSKEKQGNMILGGAIISASNPFFIIWWMAVGLGMIMAAYSTFGLAGVAAFYFGHILSDITWYGFLSIVISRTRGFISRKVYRGIVAVLGVCLIGFGGSFLAAAIGWVCRAL